MRCPACGAIDSRVLDSRPVDENNTIRRRRECTACLRRFTTYEAIDTVPLTVIKKDGSREIFDRRKLESGIIKACQKRPVDPSEISSSIEAELQNRIAGDVTTKEIGEMVMDRLKQVDGVAYVRFASVYREFRDVESFLEELNRVLAPKKPGESAAAPKRGKRKTVKPDGE